MDPDATIEELLAAWRKWMFSYIGHVCRTCEKRADCDFRFNAEKPACSQARRKYDRLIDWRVRRNKGSL